jgi:hypothetical protein
MAYIKLTAEQLAGLQQKAAADPSLAALLPAHKPRQPGVERLIADAIMRDPTITAAALQAAFPTIREGRLKSVRRAVLTFIAAAQDAGRWAPGADAPAAEASPAAEAPAAEASPAPTAAPSGDAPQAAAAMAEAPVPAPAAAGKPPAKPTRRAA